MPSSLRLDGRGKHLNVRILCGFWTMTLVAFRLPSVPIQERNVYLFIELVRPPTTVHDHNSSAVHLSKTTSQIHKFEITAACAHVRTYTLVLCGSRYFHVDPNADRSSACAYTLQEERRRGRRRKADIHFPAEWFLHVLAGVEKRQGRGHEYQRGNAAVHINRRACRPRYCGVVCSV